MASEYLIFFEYDTPHRERDNVVLDRLIADIEMGDYNTTFAHVLQLSGDKAAMKENLRHLAGIVLQLSNLSESDYTPKDVLALLEEELGSQLEADARAQAEELNTLSLKEEHAFARKEGEQ